MKSKIQVFIAFLLILLLLVVFFKPNSVNHIPNEEQNARFVLDRAIQVSKLDTNQGIESLENIKNIKDLGDYTKYKADYILARLYEQKNDYPTALSIYKKLLNKNYPFKERVIFHYAYLNTRVNKDLVALKYFNQLINQFSSSRSVPQAKYYLAQTQLRLQMVNEALKVLKSLRKEYPETQFGIASNYYLGEYAYHEKNFGDALNYWREYLKNSPDGRFVDEISDYFNKLGEVHLKLIDYSLLGDVYFHKKDYQKASYYYKVGSDKKNSYNLGYSLFREGKKNEAGAYLRDYAKYFPSSSMAKRSLLLASNLLPFYKRKQFWLDVKKDISSLAYYADYKVALLESSPYRQEELLKKQIQTYVENEFMLDAVWQIMWQKIQDKNYDKAIIIGEEYFNLSNSKKFLGDKTRARIGFWLGKLYELKGNNNKATLYYDKTSNLFVDEYYSLRAKSKLAYLNGSKDDFWSLKGSLGVDKYFWSMPLVVNKEMLVKRFGATVAELISAHQYSEAIDLIGKSKFPSEQITAWLKALNEEHDTSISLASSIISQRTVGLEHSAWRLAYPLHYWQYIFHEVEKYKNIDPFLVCALIRQESLFNKEAKSVSSAYGLMQLIWPTAKVVSSQVGIPLYSPKNLFSPKINIALGTKYISGLISELNNPLYAVAGYNAGPSAVKRWIRRQNDDLDFFIENIPYSETKTYVKKVFSNYWTYLNLYS